MLESLLLGSLALSPVAGEGEERDLEVLERRAYDFTEAKQYAEAARVWAEIACGDATDEQRGLAVMRAVSSDKLAFEAKGDAQHLCHAHLTLVAYLDRGESEQAEYLQQFRPALETSLEEQLGHGVAMRGNGLFNAIDCHQYRNTSCAPDPPQQNANH